MNFINYSFNNIVQFIIKCFVNIDKLIIKTLIKNLKWRYFN